MVAVGDGDYVVVVMKDFVEDDVVANGVAARVVADVAGGLMVVLHDENLDVELHLTGVIFAVEADDEHDWVRAGELVITDAGCSYR